MIREKVASLVYLINHQSRNNYTLVLKLKSAASMIITIFKEYCTSINFKLPVDKDKLFVSNSVHIQSMHIPNPPQLL